jgi:cytochrome oxidase assembly protein ShyY1
MPAAVMPALRLEVLAQTWPEPLIPGYVTLSRQDAALEGLPAATAPLPQTDGGARNRSYALQWWAFAAFALGMSIVFARTVGKRGGEDGRDGRR